MPFSYKTPPYTPPPMPKIKTRQKTNADRIRAMSDEELAVLFADDERACPPKHPHCSKYVDKCNGCWLEWLRQPAKEE